LRLWRSPVAHLVANEEGRVQIPVDALTTVPDDRGT
jgi:hypothetical protein